MGVARAFSPWMAPRSNELRPTCLAQRKIRSLAKLPSGLTTRRPKAGHRSRGKSLRWLHPCSRATLLVAHLTTRGTAQARTRCRESSHKGLASRSAQRRSLTKWQAIRRKKKRFLTEPLIRLRQFQSQPHHNRRKANEKSLKLYVSMKEMTLKVRTKT